MGELFFIAPTILANTSQNRYLTMPWILLANYHLANLRPAVSNNVSFISGYHPCTLLTYILVVSALPFPPSYLADVTLPNSCRVAIVSIAITQGVSIMVGIQLVSHVTLPSVIVFRPPLACTPCVGTLQKQCKSQNHPLLVVGSLPYLALHRGYHLYDTMGP